MLSNLTQLDTSKIYTLSLHDALPISFINAKGERHWVKFHFKTLQGIKNWTNAEAAEKVAHDRETHQRDLFESIEQIGRAHVNSSHMSISYAVFCLKKKIQII